MAEKAEKEKGGEHAPAEQKAEPRHDKADAKDNRDTNKGPSVSDILAKINMPASERYQIRRDLNMGGQGVCKVAFDQLTEREVVLKVSNQGNWSGERILREARIVAKLNHTNVIRVLDVGSFGKDQVYLSMPYIDGASLDQVLKRIGEASIPGLTGYSMIAVAELFDQICSGVEHAHENSVLHLDLKPQNVLVGSKGEVVVVDFGVSQHGGQMETIRRFATHDASNKPNLNTTLVGSMPDDPTVRAVGTPAYMSPEQWTGDPGTFTERTDVYGLGGVLFFLLTGHAPNQIQRPQDLEPYFRHSPVPSPGDFTRRRVAPELEALCMKCLARDPQQRYPSAFHVRHVLKTWLNRPEVWELYGHSTSF